MYPTEYFSLFPPFPKKDEVFVAMSFAEEFSPRWEKVIEPAVRRISVNKTHHLKANRVDARSIGDSILTEILTGISQSRLVFADITTIGVIDAQPIRNANVLYEIGLAQAVRLPQEVLLFRSDRDPLLFDMANIRVNFYDPDKDPEKAKDIIVNAILSSVKEIELKKQLTVQRLAETLDFPSWWALVTARVEGRIDHPSQMTMGQVVSSDSRLRSISRLLDIGALKTRYQKVTPEVIDKIDPSEDASSLLLYYECTELGIALFNYATEKTGILEPDMVKFLENKIGK